MPNLKLYADLSNAAYTVSLLDTGTWTMRGEVRNSDKNAYGFVVTHKTKNIIAVSIRGTVKTSFKNILTDLKATFYKYQYCPKSLKCKSHRGFYKQFIAMKDDLDRIVHPLWNEMKNKPNAKIIVTGHSLGAAIATLYAAYLHKVLNLPQGQGKIILVAFGSPRVGNKQLVSQINQDIGVHNIYRVNFKSDPIPKTPPLIFGYRHVGEKRIVECETEETCRMIVKKDHDTFLWNLLLKIRDHSGYFSFKKAMSIL